MDEKQFYKFALGAYVLFLGIMGTSDFYFKKKKFKVEKKVLEKDDQRKEEAHTENLKFWNEMRYPKTQKEEKEA